MRGVFFKAGRKAALAIGIVCALSLLTACQPPNQQAVLESAAASGNPQAQYVVAAQKVYDTLDKRADTAPALQNMQSLAEGGNVPAQVFLGEIYLFAPEGITYDADKSRLWLTKAADKKDPTALADLTYIYGRGLGVPVDGAKAMAYAKSAADAGDASGMVAVGTCYKRGWGVGANPAIAFDWYLKAAATKEPAGFNAVGEAYRDGTGVRPDKVMAYAWFAVSLQNAQYANDKHEAARLRDEIRIVMLPDEVDQATRLADAWTPGNDLVTARRTIAQAPAPQPVGIGADASRNVTFSSGTTRASGARVQESDIAVRDLKNNIDITVNADASYTQVMHIERQVKKESAIAELGQMPFQFNNTFDQLDITEAYTLKADGSKMVVSPSAIYEQPAPNSPTMPSFNDQRMKVVVFPNVATGDTLVVTATLKSKAMLPGFFALSYYLPRTYAMSEMHLSITAPDTMPLTTETHDLAFKKHSSGGMTSYEWFYKNPRPLVEDLFALDAFDRLPRLFVSSFRDYDQFAKVYTETVESKTVVTPKLQKLADDITAGTSDRHAQAALLHDWVSRNIRYVAVFFGHDAIIPHEATAVYEAGYGDCKDHSALLVTLLKAKGIDSQITLINFGTSYALAAPPTFGVLNHAITFIPEFNLYTDTTAGSAPFGVLPFGEYGKPVIIATKTGQVIRHTPALKTADATLNVVTNATLSKDGVVSGETTLSGTGPFATDLRATAKQIEAAGPEQSAKGLLENNQTQGTGTFKIPPPNAQSMSYSLSGTFTLAKHAEMLTGTSFFMPGGLNFSLHPGQMLAGPLSVYNLSSDEPTACYGGKVTETITLALPAGRQLRSVPKPFSINNKLMNFSSAWSVAGNKVTSRRELVSMMGEPVCIGETRRIAAEALNDIRGESNTGVALKE